MVWEIEISKPVTEWLNDLDEEDFAKIAGALKHLGPALGRPLVGAVKGSKYANLKELRSVGGHVRVQFAFDPDRHAILLVAGDKTGDWKGWYARNVPVADEMLGRHLAGETI